MAPTTPMKSKKTEISLIDSLLRVEMANLLSDMRVIDSGKTSREKKNCREQQSRKTKHNIRYPSSVDESLTSQGRVSPHIGCFSGATLPEAGT
jgi:hypothetical protein